MTDFPSFEQVTVSTELTKEQKVQARALISSMPIVALPDQMARYPKTVEDLITSMLSVRDYLRFEMTTRIETEEELRALRADITAAGRIFKLIQGEQAS